MANYRLLAFDVDGTLLDPDGTLRPRTARAIARAAEAGIRPVLCTGRRYRRALPVAEQLGLAAPLVCNSGSLVKDASGHRTLWRADLDPALLARILTLFDEHRWPVVSFTDRDTHELDFIVAQEGTGRPLFDEFVSVNRSYADVDPAWRNRLAAAPHFHLCTLGTRLEMLDFERSVLAALPGEIRTFVQKSPRYEGTMCEVLRQDASKWSAVLHLADLWGIAPEEICAVGDDMNDIPMIQGAGLGVAMGHAPAIVREAADRITSDHDHDGLAAVIDEVLLG